MIPYTLPQLIQSKGENFHKKVAFRFMNQSLTYGELKTQMHQLAHQLLDLGVKKGDRVGIFMARSLETAVAIYGIMSVGAVYVPLNPAQPLERSRKLIEESDLTILVTNKAQKRRLSSLFLEKTPIQTLIGTEQDLGVGTISWNDLNKMPTSAPEVNILESDLAYILYTSGSTGTPKGIMHTHSSGLAYARLSVAAYDLKDSDIFGNHAPIYFDISTLGFFAAPMVGATTVIASEAHIKMPTSLAQLIEKEQISIWYSVPLALIQMMQRGKLAKKNVPQLRWIIFAGEAFPTKHLRNLMQICPQARFSNAYGPTETNVCTYYNLPASLENDSPISIGKPWGNTEALIIDDKNLPVRKGEAGELLIRSATVMAGYFNRPDLNEKAFFEQSSVKGITKKYYRTGDLVKEETDGNLTFLGRKDRQVKTRGFRVELEEITTALLKNEAIAEAAVYTFENEEEQTMIGAAVTLAENAETDEQEILKNLAHYILWYAMPTRLAILNELPRTGTGKVDLKRLA